MGEERSARVVAMATRRVSLHCFVATQRTSLLFFAVCCASMTLPDVVGAGAAGEHGGLEMAELAATLGDGWRVLQDDSLYMTDFSEGEDYLPSSKVRVDVGRLVVGQPSEIMFEVRYGGQQLRWDELELEHERRLHLMLVGEGDDVFYHAHPEDSGAVDGTSTTWSVSVTFPRAGEYVAWVAVSVGGTGVTRRFRVSVHGEPDLIPAPSRDCDDKTFVGSLLGRGGGLAEPVVFSEQGDGPR